MRHLALVAVSGLLAAALGASCGIKKCTSNEDCGGATCNLSTGMCGSGTGSVDTTAPPRGGGGGQNGGLTGGGGGASEIRCDAESCANGCCQNNICQTGTTDFACGYGGATCNRCPPETYCRANACISSSTTNGLPGSECVTEAECGPVPGSFVVACAPAELPDGGPSGLPGGGCLAICSVSVGCGNTASTCMTLGNISACAPNCQGAGGGGQGTCRDGFVCAWALDARGEELPWGACVPDCRVAGVLCPALTTCNADGTCGAP